MFYMRNNSLSAFSPCRLLAALKLCSDSTIWLSVRLLAERTTHLRHRLELGEMLQFDFWLQLKLAESITFDAKPKPKPNLG